MDLDFDLEIQLFRIIIDSYYYDFGQRNENR